MCVNLVSLSRCWPKSRETKRNVPLYFTELESGFMSCWSLIKVSGFQNECQPDAGQVLVWKAPFLLNAAATVLNYIVTFPLEVARRKVQAEEGHVSELRRQGWGRGCVSCEPRLRKPSCHPLSLTPNPDGWKCHLLNPFFSHTFKKNL